MRFSKAQFEGFNANAALAEDAKFARSLRAYRPELTAYLVDDALTREVTRARLAAISFGLRDTALRARFVMIHILLTYEFWLHPEAAFLLQAQTGTPEIRFGDVCAITRLASAKAGCAEEIWW